MLVSQIMFFMFHDNKCIQNSLPVTRGGKLSSSWPESVLTVVWVDCFLVYCVDNILAGEVQVGTEVKVRNATR